MKCANNYAQKEKTNEIKMDNWNQSSMHRVLTTQAKQMLETLTDKKIAILSLKQKKKEYCDYNHDNFYLALWKDHRRQCFLARISKPLRLAIAKFP